MKSERKRTPARRPASPRARTADLADLLARSQHRVRVLEAQTAELNRSYQRLSRRRSVRAALWIERTARVVARPVARPILRLARRARRNRRREGPPREAGRHRAAGPQRTQADVVEAIRALRPSPGPAAGPLVSIIVLTRNGRAHLERLLPALRDRAAYRSFELIVVDNASDDGTDALLGRDWGLPIRVLRNSENVTFSRGNNQGLAEAKGELVLLLNNDVEPINAGWLGAMVEALGEARAPAAVGALLIYPKRPRRTDLRGDTTQPDLTVQHRGIGFGWSAGAPRARNLGGGEDPLNETLVETRPVPAATAACLLMRRDDLEAVGGLTEGYVYGTEDVDLCLTLRAAGGEIVFCGGAALFHHEFGTQRLIDRETKRANRRANAQLFGERWSPGLTRALRLDQLRGEGRWTGRTTRTAVITITEDDPGAGWGDWYTAHELGAALEAEGWTVVYVEGMRDRWYRQMPAEADLVIALLDRFDVRRAPAGAFTIAWVRSWVDRWVAHPWFGRYDLVVASSEIAAGIVRDRSDHEPVVLPLAADVARFQPLPPSPDLACDYTFTGNNWGRGRTVLEWIEVRPGERFTLYGKGWEKVPAAAPYRKGPIEYWRLPELYSSASLVIDDTAEHTLPYGAMNARVFEALACGTLVITNNVAGARELFGDLLPTYTNRNQLRAQLDRFLADPGERTRTAAKLRESVLARHTYARRAMEFVEAAERAVGARRVAIKIGPPSRDVAEQWGDTHFARAFARSLRRLGYTTQVDILPEWDAPDRQAADVVVHLWGRSVYLPKPAHVNVLWVISHPELLDPAHCEMYDLVFVASERFAEHLRGRVSVPVHVLHQATDTERFRPVPAVPDLRTEVLFVGNSRGRRRPAVDGAVAAGAPLAIYGAAWKGFAPKRAVRGTYFPNARLPELYSSASIVLADHWDDMREWGFVSNRVFDALACGALVVSDRVEGLTELLGDAVPTFETAEELRELIGRYLRDPEESERLAREGMERVRAHHSFDARARAFADAVADLPAAGPATIERPRTRAKTRSEPREMAAPARSPAGR